MKIEYPEVQKEFDKLKKYLSKEAREGIEFKLRIAKFCYNHPDTPYYINQNLQPTKGFLKSRYCKMCGANLEEIRKYNPRRRVIHFCSGNCRKEHNRRKKLREEIGAEGLFWTTYKGKKMPPRNEMKATFRDDSESVKEIHIKAKKSKWARKNE